MALWCLCFDIWNNPKTKKKKRNSLVRWRTNSKHIHYYMLEVKKKKKEKRQFSFFCLIKQFCFGCLVLICDTQISNTFVLGSVHVSRCYFLLQTIFSGSNIMPPVQSCVPADKTKRETKLKQIFYGSTGHVTRAATSSASAAPRHSILNLSTPWIMNYGLVQYYTVLVLITMNINSA